MTKTKGYGVMPAAMTFWNADESFNQKETERYLQWLIDQGAHSLSVTGSTGENISMGMEEQKRIMEVMIKAVGGKVPVYAGTGRYTTAETIELSQYAQKCGAEGILVIMPYYLIPHKRAVMNHFKELRKAVDLEICLYNNPRFCNYEMNALEVKQMLDDGSIDAIKAAHGDAERIHSLRYHCGDKLTIFYGHDYAPMEGFFAKADGWLSGMPAIFPKFCRTLFDICTIEKDVDKANDYWYKIMPFIDYFITYGTNDPHWHEIFKYILQVQGFNSGTPRRPLGALDSKEKKTIDGLLKNMQDIL
jgi:Dihydrodipicolinate synthase/N-acetylneuraminate lyase